MRTRLTTAICVALLVGCGPTPPNPDGGAGGVGGSGGSAGGGQGQAGGQGGGGGGAAGGGEGGGQPSGPVLLGNSKSSTVAVSDDGALISMVNPENHTLSTFSATTKSLLSRIATGGEPSAVVYTPGKKSAWVANRASETVRLVSALDTATPSLGTPIPVGSEPTGLALSPTGRFLVVTEWAEARVSVIDTTSNAIVSSQSVRNPRAVTITNDGDTDDSDEKVIVTEFYGRTNSAAEATDLSRTGAVQVFTLSASGTLAVDGQITFAPMADGGFGAGVSPNQLFGAAIANGKVYVAAIGASPGGAPKFDQNVAPVILVGDLATKTEVTGVAGSQSLAPLVNAFPDPKFFLADLVDLAFLGTSNVAYAVARGGEAVQRLDYGTGSTLSLGSTANKQIDLLAGTGGAACQNPTGIAVIPGKAYVNCWGNQKLGIIDLATQTLTDAVASVAAPTAQADINVNRGRHFFFTGRTRWSNSAWSSCGSCHPDGLSDNITWNFAAGPRQSTSMDGSYSHGPGTQKQRIFNWTGIIDEMHDFEGNTRGTQGGKGAITTAATQADCGNLANETQATLPPNNLAQSSKELADGLAIKCVPTAWDDIDAYARTVRPPTRRQALDPAAVTRGQAAFVEGNCANCHGGAGWSLSRRFFTPGTANNAALTTTTAFVKPGVWPLTWNFHSTFQIAVQPVAAEVAPFNAAPVAPPQVACVVRNIGTFGVPGDVAATDAIETKLPSSTRAQGRGGYNIPSLYGMQVAAPLLHHGQAATLFDLFDSPKWNNHLLAANSAFLVGDPQAATKKNDLIQFIWSIDATTPEIAAAVGFDGCP